MESEHRNVTTVDLRPIAAHERRPLVFDLFGHMQPGDTLLLTHFHHSTPLLYLLLAESPRGFTWDYLEQGPEVWRIRIRKSRLQNHPGRGLH